MSYPGGPGQDMVIPTLDGHQHTEIENLRTGHGKLERRVGDLERGQAELRSGLDGCAEAADSVAGHGDQLGQHEARIAALTARLAWLEGVVRAAGLAPADDLAPDTETRRLAHAAAAGYAAQRGLLNADQRASRKATITYLAKVRAERAEAMTAASAAAEALGVSVAGAPAHDRAAERYRRARATITAADKTLAEHGDVDQRYEKDLALDDAARATFSPTLLEGVNAERKLRERLRARLDGALGHSAILPEWFTVALGPTAPASDPAAWFDAALALLVYRATFGVADPRSPLGVPSATDDQHQRTMRRTVNDLLKAAGMPG